MGCSVRASPRVIGIDLSSQQQAELILFLDDLLLQFGQLGGSAGPFGLESIQIEFRYIAVIKAQPRNPDALFPRLQGALGDVDLKIERTKIEIGFGDVADQSDDHRPLVLFLGQKLGSRRLDRPTDAAPEIQFPFEADESHIPSRSLFHLTIHQLGLE